MRCHCVLHLKDYSAIAQDVSFLLLSHLIKSRSCDRLILFCMWTAAPRIRVDIGLWGTSLLSCSLQEFVHLQIIHKFPCDWQMLDLRDLLRNWASKKHTDVAKQKGYVPCFLQGKNTHARFGWVASDESFMGHLILWHCMHFRAAVAVMDG